MRKKKRNRISSKELFQIALITVFCFWLLLVWVTIKTI